MVRLILLILLILFVLWILQPFLGAKDSNNNTEKVDKTLGSNQKSFRKQNMAFMILAAITLLALVVWLSPKFGVNLFALIQKIIAILSPLRAILPF